MKISTRFDTGSRIANFRIQPHCGFVQHDNVAATTGRAASSASRTRAGSGCFQLYGGVKTGSQSLFKTCCTLSIGRPTSGFAFRLPVAVFSYGQGLPAFELQHGFATEGGYQLLALHQALALEHLALHAISRNNEDLADNAFNSSDDIAHLSSPVAPTAL